MRCTDCGADLRPPEPEVSIDRIAWRPREYLERGAAQVREIVAERKRKRDG